MLIVAAIGLGGYAVLRLESLTGSPDSFRLDLEEQLTIDASLIQYHQSNELALPMKRVQAIATGPDDRIYVAGDRAVQVFQPDGRLERSISTQESPHCLAVGHLDHVAPGRVYVGAGRNIEVFDRAGDPVATWEDIAEKAVLTSIAVSRESVFVADAGNRVVLRFTVDGELGQRIGDERPGGASPAGFIIPSAYFDVVTDPNDLLYVVNPGARRIETYTLDGVLQTVWGESGSDIAGFFGCCNPSHLAQLPDGRFVTSEKGIPRVKVYDSEGILDCVVAGPEQLSVRFTSIGDPRAKEQALVFDVAVDSEGRVLVLDPMKPCVRVFVSNSEEDKDPI